MCFRLAYLHLTLAHSKGQGQAKVMHISTENTLDLLKDIANIIIAIKYENAYNGLRLAH